MKFTGFKTGQVGLSLLYCFLMTACQPSDYYMSEEFLAGEDSYCSQAKDLISCQALSDRCQPAFKMSENEDEAPVFDMCISNSHEVPNDGSTTGGTDGGATTGETDGGATAGTDGGSTDGSVDGGSTGGETDGGATAGTDGGTTGGETDGGVDGGAEPTPEPTPSPEPTPVPVPNDPGLPTLEEALEAKCSNVPSQHMWIKKEVQKKNGKASGTKVTKKVKICHITGNGSAHTIVIACPALKAHIKHNSHASLSMVKKVKDPAPSEEEVESDEPVEQEEEVKSYDYIGACIK